MTIEGVPEGWTARTGKAFRTHVGPFYSPPGDTPGEAGGFGFLADERHGNKRGVVHGGMIATAFDVALGEACWIAAKQRPCATVQLNVHYVGAIQLGEFAFIRPELVKATRSMVFLRGMMTVGDRVVATADGVWKILQWRGEPYAAS